MAKHPQRQAKQEEASPEGSVTRNITVTELDESIPAPEILIDGFQGMSLVGGVAKLRCFSARPTPEHPNAAALVLRLAMPAPAVKALYDTLGQIIPKMVQDGFLPKED